MSNKEKKLIILKNVNCGFDFSSILFLCFVWHCQGGIYTQDLSLIIDDTFGQIIEHLYFPRNNLILINILITRLSKPIYVIWMWAESVFDVSVVQFYWFHSSSTKPLWLVQNICRQIQSIHWVHFFIWFPSGKRPLRYYLHLVGNTDYIINK